jgi:hypothetical protein
VNDLQTEAHFVGMDAEDYAAGRVEKRMKEFQCGPRQVVVDTAGARRWTGGGGRGAVSGRRCRVGRPVRRAGR